MKKFRVRVEGKTYEVEVEELGEETDSASAKQPSPSGEEAKSEPKTPPKSPESKPKSPPKKPEKKAEPAKKGGASGQIVAPMPGTVLEIKVSEGDEVSSGQVVALLEAMKMENEIKAASDGTVKEVLVSKQSSVETGDALIVLE